MPLPAGGMTTVRWGDFTAIEFASHSTADPVDGLSFAHTYPVVGTYSIVVSVRDNLANPLKTSVLRFIATSSAREVVVPAA